MTSTHERLGWHVHQSEDGNYLLIRETYKPESRLIAEINLDVLRVIQHSVNVGVSVADVLYSSMCSSKNFLDMRAVMRCLIQTEWITTSDGNWFV